MVLVVTVDHLLFVEAEGRGWRMGPIVGAIPRCELKSVTLPYIGSGPWKVARIERTSGAIAQVLVRREGAEDFLKYFADMD
jgi:hypothetical protein